MKTLLKEPLLHFFLIGALLFALDAWRNNGAPETDATGPVRVGEQDVRWLKESWTQVWKREPSEAELRGLVTDYLKESLLAREAREMGLEENDTIIRRRLAQKLEFLVQDTARLAEPGEEQLRTFFETRRERFQTPARVSFTQLYFSSEDAAGRGLEQLARRGADELGERSLLGREHHRADEDAVASQFGRGFARAVFALAPGPWHGPLASAYGFHVVRVSALEAAQTRSLEEVRGQVIAEWYGEQQSRVKEQYFAALLKKYDVMVDQAVRPLIDTLVN